MIIRGRRPKLAKSRSELAPYTGWVSESAGRDGVVKHCGGVRTRPQTELCKGWHAYRAEKLIATNDLLKYIGPES